MTDEADKAGKAEERCREEENQKVGIDEVRGTMVVGLIVGPKEKARVKTPAKVLYSLMSRDGLEPSTHWLKASFGDFE
jgi:hypothetical protein